MSKLEQHPIPRIEDFFRQPVRRTKVHKVRPKPCLSPNNVTINTHKGLFTYRNLPFAVSSSPAIFQRIMEELLQVAVFLDDILLTGRTDQEHLQALTEVLLRLKEASLRLKRARCSFTKEEVIFLGHRLDAMGLYPVHEKLQAIKDALTPSNLTELKACLGLLNYSNKFLPRLSTSLSPLQKLLQ